MARLTTGTNRTRSKIEPKAELAAFGVNEQLHVCLDLLDPAQSLHQVCQSHRLTLPELAQLWLDCLPQVAHAASFSEQIARMKNAFELSQKHGDLTSLPRFNPQPRI